MPAQFPSVPFFAGQPPNGQAEVAYLTTTLATVVSDW